MKTLAVIPARAGSKGIPGKNTRNFMGKPLVSWAIECGKRTCDQVCVTTDDPVVLEIADEYGVQSIARPADLAQDETPMVDVLRHVLAQKAGCPGVLVLLEATQPLRRDDHVRQAVDLLTSSRGLDSVVSVMQIPPHHSPDYAVYIEHDRIYCFAQRVVTRRQDCRPAYYRDGTVYAMRRDILERGQMYGRSAPLLLRAGESCTIDTEDDWKRAERLWRERHAQPA